MRGFMIEQMEEVNFAIPLRQEEDNSHSAATTQGSSTLMDEISLQVWFYTLYNFIFFSVELQSSEALMVMPNGFSSFSLSCLIGTST